MGPWRDYEHLLRLGAIFVVGILAFAGARALLVPDDFGEIGHYRASSPDEVRRAPLRFAGHAVCGECHTAVLDERVGGKHAAIGCESCHGSLAAHAADPAAQQPVLPEVVPLCAGCHAQVTGRPSWFPQVDVAEHAAGAACGDCHDPHHPDF